MRVTLAQIGASTDQQANALIAADAAEEAARIHADLLVLPEYSAAYDPRGVGTDLASADDGVYLTAVRELARARQVTIICGVAEPGGEPGSDGQPRARNSLVVIGPDGREVTRYRKVHLYDAFGTKESDQLAPGDPAAPAVVVSVAGVAVGLMTCYDLRFPESARRLVDAGAQVIVVPAAWAVGPGKVEQWTVLARARAIENVAAVVAVGLTGRGVCGSSLVVGPDGRVVTSMDVDETGWRTVDIDPEQIAAARDKNPSLENRRYKVVPA